MALAGDHAEVAPASWRVVAAPLYIIVTTIVAIGLLVLFPPKFDLRLSTIFSVVVVGAFLVAMERPKYTAATTVAPLTAISAASVVVFGYWVIPLSIIALLAVRFNMTNNEVRWRNLLRIETLLQSAIAIDVAYASIGLWGLITIVQHSLPLWSMNFTTLLGIIVLGIGSQTCNNVFAYLWYAIRGHPFSIGQLFRTGLIASIYAYLLVATYRFGGLLATAIFYLIVAQIRVVQDVLGVTAQLHKLEKAHDQARGLVKDMIHLTDSDGVQFSSEVQNIALMLGQQLGMSRRDLDTLTLAAELHEMGKARLPARIRYGTGLSAKEKAQKQTYSRWGALMVRAADALLPAQLADTIEFHGEHYDGSGYPRGLKGEAIPLGSRIIAVSRDYVRYLTGFDGAPVLDKEKALTLLRDGSGTLYDPKIVKLLFDLVS